MSTALFKFMITSQQVLMDPVTAHQYRDQGDSKSTCTPVYMHVFVLSMLLVP